MRVPALWGLALWTIDPAVTRVADPRGPPSQRQKAGEPDAYVCMCSFLVGSGWAGTGFHLWI